MNRIDFAKLITYGLIVLIALNLLGFEINLYPFNQTTFNSMTVYPAPIGNVVYGGEQHKISVAIFAELLDETSSQWQGGSVANGCDNIVIEIYAKYPDGYTDKIRIPKGPLTSEQIVSAITYYTILENHGQGTLNWEAFLVCEETTGNRFLLSRGKSAGDYWYNQYYPRNPCSGVTCDAYCDGYTWYGGGQCVPNGANYRCEYSLVEYQSSKCGWIDTDGDGIIDSEDACPTQQGLAKFSGCPDTDGDGIPDNQDACPNQAGDVQNNGCPVQDSDGDGIPDNQDACPNEAGTQEYKGCPPPQPQVIDTDGDGIPDNQDLCPFDYGTQENMGCPAIPSTGNEDIVRPSTPYTPPVEETTPPAPVCGNNVCEAGESALNCPSDCLSKPTIINLVLGVTVVVLLLMLILK